MAICRRRGEPSSFCLRMLQVEGCGVNLPRLRGHAVW
jgi:hypothetical protein